ncbi:signal peptidase I [Chlamydiota bacterium]
MSKKKPLVNKFRMIIQVIAIISIFTYLYSVHKAVTTQYMLHSVIFSVVALFFIKSYFIEPEEWNKSILVAFVIALIARTFIVQAFKIPTGSMEPTLHGDPLDGDRVLVNKFMYHFRKPKRGDIVVFRTVNIPGLDGQKDFIKRLAALPGERVELKDGNLYVDSHEVTRPNIFREIDYVNTRRFMKGVLGEGQFGLKSTPVRIPKDNYYVLGDHSRVSRDSRFWGYVPQENLMGQAVMIYWPLKRFRLLKEK